MKQNPVAQAMMLQKIRRRKDPNNIFLDPVVEICVVGCSLTTLDFAWMEAVKKRCVE